MKTMAVFGGSGGLGSKVVPLLRLRGKYRIISLSSKDVDVTVPSEVGVFFAKNKIDIVLNLSGLKHDALISDMTVVDKRLTQEMLDVNIMGNINILSYCLCWMREAGWGRVIAISSVFAELDIPYNSIYSASKAFLDRLMSVANRENIKHGITCNTIQLGYWDGGMSDRVELKYKNAAIEKIGLKRLGTTKELCNTIDFIIENEYICGTKLKIDGGL